MLIHKYPGTSIQQLESLFIMASDDLETQPLLGNQSPSQDPSYTPPVSQQPLPTERTHAITARRNNRWKYLVGAAVTAVILLFTSFKVSAFVQHSPSVDEIQDNAMKISNVKVQNFHIDGWRKSKRDQNLDNDEGKYLQVTALLDYSLNYDLLDKSMFGDDPEKMENFKFGAENLVRTLCVDLNNSTTFNNVNDTDLKLASVTIVSPFCVSLQNGSITPLNLTLLIEPNMKNIMDVLKKLITHRYKGLQLWSAVDVTLYKQTLLRFNIRLTNLPNITINWTRIFKWDKLIPEWSTYITDNFHIPEVTELKVTDDEENFLVKVKTEPVGSLQGILDHIPWLTLPLFNFVPSIRWDLRLPNCHNKCTIELPTLECISPEFDLMENDSLVITNKLGGPLPRELLTHVCSSDEENTVTPLTLILNSLMNDSLDCSVEVRGSVQKTRSPWGEGDMLLPPDILQDMLDGLGYIPITTNLTVNTTEILDEVSIENMQLKWLDGRLRMVGTVTASMAMAFYKTKEDRLAIHNIKGDFEIYHENDHFLSIPMRVWTDSVSEIKHDSDTGDSYMDVTFDLRDDDMIVTDKGTLSQVFNEIFFQGETRVTFNATLDVVVQSVLGEVVLSGLKTDGETLIH